MNKATRQAYGEALVELAKTNDKVVVLDADLAHATMTSIFKDAYPDRHYNVGIAEADLVDIAGGMSTTGLVPFCSTFAMFGIGRAFEQIRNSIAYPRLNVKLAMTHAGITVGPDGGSHACIEDIALMRVVPGMTVVVPADANETYACVAAAAEMDGPVYIRLARMATPVFEGDMVKPFTLGKANVLREGSDVAIFACGIMVAEALKAADLLAEQGVSAAVINMHTIKPLDADCVREYAKRCGKLVAAEEASTIGGLGDAISSVLVDGQLPAKLIRVGVQDVFGQSGEPEELMREYGLDAESIVKKVLEA
ncbi:MAG: transketolase family protein [Oscillospiraceae bacterium]|nr:transketolase family protein [Oscillospiraceae bacterium]